MENDFNSKFEEWWEEQYRSGTTYTHAISNETFGENNVGATIKQIAKEAWEASLQTCK